MRLREPVSISKMQQFRLCNFGCRKVVNIRSNYPSVVREGQPLLALFTSLKEEEMGNPYGHPKPQYEGLSQKEKQAAYNKACYEKHKEERQTYGREYSKEYREKNADTILPKKRNQWLLVNFQRTPEWYEETLVSQGGHCALCESTPEGRRFQVDHNHDCCPTDKTHRKTCGKCVRGLLCEACNTRLGYLEQLLNEATSVVPKWDTWLENAILYLKKYSG